MRFVSQNDLRHKKLGLAWAGALLILITIVAIFFGDRALWDGQPFLFQDREGASLAGTYYPGDAGYTGGVLLLEGFGSDSVTLRSLANEFARAGLSVMTFDFSGHGRSSGALTFDNAATDRLAHQALAAVDAFKARSGLEEGEIVLVGHSMGARVALQATVIAPETRPFAGLVLLGPQVNLATNIQSEVFTGVSDADLAWVQSLGPQTPPVDVLIASGSWDDIFTQQAGHALLAKLTSVGEPQPGTAYGNPGAMRRWVLVPALLHNYEVFSPRALGVAIAGVARMLDLSLPSGAPAAGWRVALWMAALIGIFGALGAVAPSGDRLRRAAGDGPQREVLPPLGDQPQSGEGDAYRDRYVPQVVSMGRFLWAKLWLWLAALPVIGLVFGLAFLVPMGVPVFNLIYVGFIGGYGLLLLILYAIGRMPGVAREGSVEGRGSLGRLLLRGSTPSSVHRRAPVVALTVGLITGLVLIAFTRTGWFFAPPTGNRLIWLGLFTPITALGFRISEMEGRMVAAAAPDRRWPRVAITVTGLVPFFLWTIFQLAIGSLSGLIGSLQGLVILSLVLLMGQAMRRFSRLPWLTAFWQAVVLYVLVLPQGVLFVVGS
jgi:pimeloyl-ACP methyl ester carboxylesterase